MKSLIKYQLVLLITLVVGYSQLFIPVSGFNAIGQPSTSEELKSRIDILCCSEIFYFEEDRDGEDEKLCRKPFEHSDYFTFPDHATWQYATSPAFATISKSILIYPASGHAVFLALRL